MLERFRESCTAGITRLKRRLSDIGLLDAADFGQATLLDLLDLRAAFNTVDRTTYLSNQRLEISFGV